MDQRAVCRSSVLALVLLVLQSCESQHRPTTDPIVHTTRGSDTGPAVLRSALESFGIPVTDYEQLARECRTDESGTSIDDLEDVANRRGLRATQLIMPVLDLLSSPRSLPAIGIVGSPPQLDFWLIWRRERDGVVVMNPRAGLQRIPIEELARRLYVHEMGESAGRIRGTVFLTLEAR